MPLCGQKDWRERLRLAQPEKVYYEAITLLGLSVRSDAVSVYLPNSLKGADKAKGPPKEIAVDLGGDMKLKLVLIPAGEFMMGSSESAEELGALLQQDLWPGRLKSESVKGEQPQHRVRITKPFYLGTYHVTRGQFRQFVETRATRPTPRRRKRRAPWQIP